MESQFIPYYDDLSEFLKAVKAIDAPNRCFGIFPFEQFGGPGETVSPFRSNTYVVALVTEGQGTLHLDGIPYDIRPGTAYFVRPWMLRSLHKENQWQGYVLLFTQEFIAKRAVSADSFREHPFYRRGAHPVIHVEPTETQSLNILFEQIFTEYRSTELDNSDRFDLIFHLLQALLIKSRHVYRKALSATDYSQPVSLVESFQHLLQTYYVQNAQQQNTSLLSVNEAASRLHINPHYLSDILKKYTGKTALQHIRERTALEAQILLRNTNLTVAQIGYLLCFDDPSNFTKFFKSTTGLTPRAYREQELPKRATA